MAGLFRPLIGEKAGSLSVQAPKQARIRDQAQDSKCDWSRRATDAHCSSRRGDRVRAPTLNSPAVAPEKPVTAWVRGRLFRKYVGLFLAVVCIALLTNGLSEICLLLSGAQGIADPHPARAGRGGGGQDQPVHQGDREPGGVDHAAAVVRRHHRSAAVRRTAAAAAGAGDHRALAARCHRPRAIARLAPGHGRGGKQGRLLQGAEIRRSGCAQGLLRARSISAASPSPT